MDNKLAQAIVDAWDAMLRMNRIETIDLCDEDVPLALSMQDDFFKAIDALRVPPPVLTFPLFVELPSLTNQRVHWRQHAPIKKKHRYIAWTETLSQLNIHKNPQGQIYVTLTRIVQRGKVMDKTNLDAAFKSIMDGIADAFGIDDGDPRWDWNCDQRKPEKSDPPGLTGTVSISWKE